MLNSNNRKQRSQPLSLFNELKRRNVFRVGVAYVVIAWLVAQVLQLVFESFGTPDWAIKSVLVLLAIGLPFALFFAWAFEMTPEGLKREHEVDRTESITPQTGKKLNRLIFTVMALALAYFSYDKFVLSAGRDAALIEAATQAAEEQAEADLVAAGPVAAAESDKSIAVLPFVNMSDDAGNEYFSDGISEEILNALAKVKELKVAGRTSSFAFKGQNQDLRKIGETLGVQNILEGSVRKAGGKVRITAQLVKVNDGFHLWSETYDRELNDVFAIQDEIATAILHELKAALLDGIAPLVTSKRTDSEVYDLYLLAKQRMYERTELTLQSAAELLDKAIAIDTGYAPAYAQRGITELLLSESSYGKIPQAQSNAQAKLYLDKALELDANLGEAWAGLGLYYNGPPPQPRKSVTVLERALSINPNLINAGNWLTLGYWSLNRVTEAMTLLDEITTRDPLYKPAFGNRVFQMGQMGRADEARAYIDRIEPFMLDDVQISQTRAWIDYEEGKTASGLKRMQIAMQRQPNDRVFKVGVNQGHYLTHQYDKVFDDNWSDYYITAMFNLGNLEEASIVAQKQAANGIVLPLFSLLNASDQSDLLIEYLEDRWPDLAAFQQAVPAAMWGYREMAEIALAYRRAGNQARFDEAMTRLDAGNQKSYSQGVRSQYLLMTMAAYFTMAGAYDDALAHLGDAIDKGFVASSKISRQFPFFRELDGNPDYEAIQSRMIEHLNVERAKLGLEPATS
jgi:TolB-like protein